MSELSNHDKMPQALRHFDDSYDPRSAVTQPSKLIEYPLTASVYFRGSTDEWVLEIEGTINDTFLVSRHPAPKALRPEDVPGLYHLYQEPIDRSDELEELIERISARQAHATKHAYPAFDRQMELTQLLTLQDKQNLRG